MTVAQSAHFRGRRGIPRADRRARSTELRAKARRQRVYLRVVKNTLARRAVAARSSSASVDKLKGPLVLAFSQDDPGAAARADQGFAKDNDKLVPKPCRWAASVLPGKDIERRREPADPGAGARAAAGRAQGARSPSSCARSRSRTAKLVRTIAAVRDQKQAARLTVGLQQAIRVFKQHYLGDTQMAANEGRHLERDLQA